MTILNHLKTSQQQRKCPGCGEKFAKHEPYKDVSQCEVCERYGTKRANTGAEGVALPVSTPGTTGTSKPQAAPKPLAGIAPKTNALAPSVPGIQTNLQKPPKPMLNAFNQKYGSDADRYPLIAKKGSVGEDIGDAVYAKYPSLRHTGTMNLLGSLGMLEGKVASGLLGSLLESKKADFEGSVDGGDGPGLSVNLAQSTGPTIRNDGGDDTLHVTGVPRLQEANTELPESMSNVFAQIMQIAATKAKYEGGEATMEARTGIKTDNSGIEGSVGGEGTAAIDDTLTTKDSADRYSAVQDTDMSGVDTQALGFDAPRLKVAMQPAYGTIPPQMPQGNFPPGHMSQNGLDVNGNLQRTYGNPVQQQQTPEQAKQFMMAQSKAPGFVALPNQVSQNPNNPTAGMADTLGSPIATGKLGNGPGTGFSGAGTQMNIGQDMGKLATSVQDNYFKASTTVQGTDSERYPGLQGIQYPETQSKQSDDRLAKLKSRTEIPAEKKEKKQPWWDDRR